MHCKLSSDQSFFRIQTDQGRNDIVLVLRQKLRTCFTIALVADLRCDGFNLSIHEKA